MRVLLADLETEWRGGQNQAFLLLQGLRQHRHSAELLSVAGGALAERAEIAGVPVHTVGSALRRPQAARLLRRMLQQFDLVHANEAHALTAAWLARAHQHLPLVAARRVLFPLRRGAVSLARYRAAACIIAVSQAVRSQLCAAGLEPSRIEVIADGVDLPEPLSCEEREQARARFDLPSDAPVATYVAPFTEEKGHSVLLDAFVGLRQSVPDCRLLLVGTGPLEDSVRERARDRDLLPAIHFAGFLDNLRLAYAACDVFVFPSLREGMGSAMLTAMSFALPVVAFHGGSIGEVLEDGSNGLIVPPTADDLAQAAIGLLTNKQLASRLGAAARRTVQLRFSAGRMVEATEAIYRKLVGSG